MSATTSKIAIQIAAQNNTRKAFEDVLDALNKVDKRTVDLGGRLDQFGTEAATGIGRLSAAFEGLDRGAGRASGGGGGVGKLMGLLGGGAVVGAAVGLERMTSAWATSTQQLGVNAKLLSTPVAHLDALQGAATLTGVSSDALTGSLLTLQRGMYDAKAGKNGGLASLLQFLGVKGDSATQALGQISDKIRAAHDPMVKLDIATQVFGENAVALMPLLDRGSDGIDRLTQTAKRYGVQTDLSVGTSEKFIEAQGELSLSVKHLKDQFTTDMGPAISAILLGLANDVHRLSPALDDWAKNGGPDRLKDKVVNTIKSVEDLIDKMRSARDVMAHLTPDKIGTNTWIEDALPWTKKVGDFLNDIGLDASTKLRNQSGDFAAPQDGLLHPSANLSTILDRSAQHNAVPPSALRALINYESGGRMIKNPDSSAFGFGQLTDGTAKDMGVNSHDPVENLFGSAKRLKQMLDLTHGDLIGAVDAYHDGPGHPGVKWLQDHPGDYSRFSAAGQAEGYQVNANYYKEQQDRKDNRGFLSADPNSMVGRGWGGVNDDSLSVPQGGGGEIRVQVDVKHDGPAGSSATVKTSGSRNMVVDKPRVATTSVARGY